MRLVITARRFHSAASRSARAASVARRNLPQKSSSHDAATFPSMTLVVNGGVNLVAPERSRPPAIPSETAGS